MRYSFPIRIVHALFALGITLQLLLSTVMEQPRPDRVRTAFEAFTFTAHEYIGLAVFALLVLHWLLHVADRSSKGLVHFFPWFSRARRVRLAVEARVLGRLKFATPDAQDALAGAVQGFGLVIATLLALTGVVVYFGMASDGTMSAFVRSTRKVHTAIAPVMWGYLVIHIAAAMGHVAAGHRSVLAIFRLRRA